MEGFRPKVETTKKYPALASSSHYPLATHSLSTGRSPTGQAVSTQTEQTVAPLSPNSRRLHCLLDPWAQEDVEPWPKPRARCR
jgi:hypothetical protein